MSPRSSRPRCSFSLSPPVLCAVAVLLSGCPDKKEPPTPTAGSTATPQAPRPPEELFVSLNCRVCHGPGAMFAPALANARSKPDETVAMWIYNAQKVKPGTAMPDFSEQLTTQEALGLARWVKAGNPAPPAGTP